MTVQGYWENRVRELEEGVKELQEEREGALEAYRVREEAINQELLEGK